MKKRLIGILMLICILIPSGCAAKPISRLEIFPASMSLVPGVSIQLVAEGYTEDEKPAAKEDLAALILCWEYQCDDGSFTVDENGRLSALSPGTGNVWVKTEDGSLHSRPTTVFVKEDPA